MIPGLLDLDPTTVLTTTQTLVHEQREADVDELRLVLAWADLHSDHPREGRTIGSDQLLQFGGPGTPPVRELCWAELAIARHAGLIATKHLAADALDLRHRLPLLWEAVQDHRLPAWVARKVAALSRNLSADAVGLVDVAVAAAVDQAPGRILTIAEAKIIEADPDAHRTRLAADATKVGVRVSQPRPGDTIDDFSGEPATLRVTLKLPPGTALGFDDTVAQVAETLHDQLPAEEREHITRGELQAKAVELLSNPHAAAAFLDTANDTTTPDHPDPEAGPEAGPDTDPADAGPGPADAGPGPGAGPSPKKTKRRPAILYLHLTDHVLSGRVDGVARVEGIGPMLLDQLPELLRDRDLTIQPVLDLNHTHSVNGYEHPTPVKTRTLLRTLGDVFPHSPTTGYRRLDHDHAAPYVPPDQGGPPGQTGDHNDAPLTRTHHRVKTHQPGYQLHQLGLGTYRWATPHGLARLVTPTGTHTIGLIRDPNGHITGEIYHPDRRAT